MSGNVDPEDAMSQNPAMPVPPELEEKLAELSILRQALEEQKGKAADYYDQLIRLRADFDNFRKRTEREKAEAQAWGKQQIVLPLLSLIDVLDQAISQARTAKDPGQIVKGLEFLQKGFTSFLKSEGIEPIEAVGKAFDPHLAEAVDQQEVDGDDVGNVLGEIQKGYRFQGRVLRPSRVRVGIAKKDAKDAADETSA